MLVDWQIFCHVFLQFGSTRTLCDVKLGPGSSSGLFYLTENLLNSDFKRIAHLLQEVVYSLCAGVCSHGPIRPAVMCSVQFCFTVFVVEFQFCTE